MQRYIQNRLAWLQVNHPPLIRSSDENRLTTWDYNTRGPMRIGLSGYNCATGLGYQNRDLVDKLPLQEWLVVEHPTKPLLPLVSELRTTLVNLEASTEQLAVWLDRIDCLLFYEQPFISQLTTLAKQKGVAVVCISNWEWLNPRSNWLADVDAFICPNRYTYDLLMNWKRLSKHQWQVEHVAAPIDVNRFMFRQRRRCESFLFVNGNGGCKPYLRGFFKDRRGPARKGLETVLDAAREIPDIPILVRSQVELPMKLPSNVTLLPPTRDNTQLYEVGDVAIQPSLFEGTGLQMLETLAAGLPLITTDASPMNEIPLLGRIRCSQHIGRLAGKTITINLPDPKHLAELMRSLHRSEISTESLKARHYVEENASWHTACPKMEQILKQKPTA